MLFTRYPQPQAPKPPYLHCILIGIECRYSKIGAHPRVYANRLFESLQRPLMTIEERSSLPLLLIAFHPIGYAPDREKVLRIINDGPHRDSKVFYNFTELSHHKWLDAITEHKFVLIPFGNGLDTIRLYEVLIMGGIPVTRRSSISSCYDDSDNVIGNSSRASLPIVILDSWSDLSKSRLDMEWERLIRIPNENWEWKRLLVYSWIDRIISSAGRSLADLPGTLTPRVPFTRSRG